MYNQRAVVRSVVIDNVFIWKCMFHSILSPCVSMHQYWLAAFVHDAVHSSRKTEPSRMRDRGREKWKYLPKMITWKYIPSYVYLLCILISWERVRERELEILLLWPAIWFAEMVMNEAIRYEWTSINHFQWIYAKTLFFFE